MQAYLISRWVWQKRVNVKKILNSIDCREKKKPMTDEQMMERVKALNAMFGGKVEQK